MAKNYKQKEFQKPNALEQPKPQIQTLERNYKFNEFWFVFLFGLTLYIQTLAYKFALDDTLVITENKFTKEGVSGIGKILSNDSFVGFFGENKNLLPGGRYRPLTQIMFAIEYQFFGLNPFIGHLINILLYGLLGVVLLKTLKKLIGEYKGRVWYLQIPFLSTCLFLAHPIHTEVVANIKGRDEINCLIFCLISLYFYIKYFEKPNAKYLLITIITLFLGLMSKENAVTFLAILPLSIYFFKSQDIKKNIVATGIVTTSLILFLIVRYFALGFVLNLGVIETELLNNPYVGIDNLRKHATNLYTFGLYLKLLILPHPLTHDYYPKQIPIISFSDIRSLLSILINLVLLIIAILGIKKRTIISYSIFFYFITFSVASNVAFNVGTFMNERFMFAPSIGFCLILAYFLFKYLPEKLKIDLKKPAIIIALSGLILVLYSFKTITRNPVWKDDFTLFTTDAATSTNSSKCNVSAGGELIKKAQEEKDTIIKMEYLNRAINHLSKGTEIYPKNIAGWLLYGSAFLYSEKYDEAITCYENCLRITPDYSFAQINLTYLGQITFKKKKYDLSLKSYYTLLKHKYKKPEIYLEMALVYDETNKLDSVFHYLNKAIEINPKYYQAYNKLGEIYGKRLGDLNTSIKYLLKAYELKNDDVPILQNLGVAYGISKNFSESIKYLEKAIEIDPKNPDLYMNLAGSYDNIGMKEKAQQCAIKANEIRQEKLNKVK